MANNEINSTELIELIKSFVNVSKNSIAHSLERIYSKVYYGTKINVSFYAYQGGATRFRKSPTFAFLEYKQKVNKGIYPIIHFNRKIDKDNFTIAYGTSQKNKPDVNWDKEILKKGETGDVGEALYYTYTLTVNSPDDIEKNKNKIISIINEMIYDFHKQFNNKTPLPEVEDMSVDCDDITLNKILYGPPGTGKTYTTVIEAIKILDNDLYKKYKSKKADYKELQAKYKELKNDKKIEFITFHQSYSYEEFIEGIKPATVKNQVQYKIEDGILKEICSRAEKSKDKFVLIIDEINRGNISKIFGELIALVEEDKRGELSAKLTYSKKDFTVPKNLYIIGTMNTSDRSIASLDIALRRRFKFVEMMPKINLLEKNSLVKNVLSNLNQRICALLDRDHQIGHSYFIDIENGDIEKFKNVWFDSIIPLLNEYFYSDWEKLEAILGCEFVVSKNKPKFATASFNDCEDKIYNFASKNDFKDNTKFITAIKNALLDCEVDS